MARAVAARRDQGGPGDLADGAACGHAEMGPETPKTCPGLLRVSYSAEAFMLSLF